MFKGGDDRNGIKSSLMLCCSVLPVSRSSERLLIFPNPRIAPNDQQQSLPTPCQEPSIRSERALTKYQSTYYTYFLISCKLAIHDTGVPYTNASPPESSRISFSPLLWTSHPGILHPPVAILPCKNISLDRSTSDDSASR